MSKDVKKTKKTYNRRLVIILLIVAVLIVMSMTMPDGLVPTIEKKALVITAALDKKESDYVFAAQILFPMQQSEGSAVMKVMEGEGESVPQAIESLNIKLGKEAELSHCGLIVLGKTLAEEGAEEPLGFLLSSGYLSPQTNLFVSEDSASVFMEKLNAVSENMNLSIYDILSYSKGAIHVSTTSALQFLSQNNTVSKTSSMPLVSISEKMSKLDQSGGSGGSGGGSGGSGGSGGGSGGSGGNGGSGGSGGSGGGGQKEYEIDELVKSVIFYDFKKSIILSETASRGLGWQNEKNSRGLITVKDLTIGDDTIDFIPMIVDNKSFSLKTENKVKPTFIIEVDVGVKLQSQQMTEPLEIKYGEKKVKDAVEEAAEKLIRKEIETLLSECGEFDPLQLKTYLYKHRLEEYKKLKDGDISAYEIEYKINVQM